MTSLTTWNDTIATATAYLRDIDPIMAQSIERVGEGTLTPNPNLFETLDAAGAGAADVLKTTVYVVASSQDDLVRVWTVVKAAFEPSDPPSTLLGVAILGYRDQLVEIEAVALVPAASDPAPGSG